MTHMPALQTERLVIRPFVEQDLGGIHRILDIELADAETGSAPLTTLEERARWLHWTITSYDQLARLYQPPYGDRAVVLRDTDQLIGACGYTPALNAFEQIPSFAGTSTGVPAGRYSAEVGLYYAIDPAHQGRGYASEAAQALVDYAFRVMRLRRIVATTTYDNAGSIGVMRKLAMRIERNPFPGPAWLQVVGVIENV